MLIVALFFLWGRRQQPQRRPDSHLKKAFFLTRTCGRAWCSRPSIWATSF
ncbi:hypothetical protein ACRAWD_15100 [Caulobacter segnis]